MDKKAVSEIKKAVSHSDCRIDRITGIFVDENGEIITELKDTWNAMQAEETEKFCEIFSKVLSGKIGKNLYNMSFPLQEELDEGKQVQLYRVLERGFGEDRELALGLMNRIRETYDRAGRQLILLAHGAYDIPAKAGDGMDMEDASDYVYMFMVCAICPVVEVKEGLCFDEATFSFINKRTDLGVQMPSIGFLFPAFNDRLPDIHSMLYYAKKEDERHLELIDELVGSDMPASESTQKEVFSELVERTLGDDCDFENVRELTKSVNEMLKEEKDAEEPVELGELQVRRIMTQAGIAGSKLENFTETFEETVGEGKTLSGENIGGRSVMEIKSPSVKISVKSDMADMISTRIIGGREFLLIPLQEDVELNGIRLCTCSRKNDMSYQVGTGADEEPEKSGEPGTEGEEPVVEIPF